jgi:hypothetical protein
MELKPDQKSGVGRRVVLITERAVREMARRVERPGRSELVIPQHIEVVATLRDAP